MREPAAVRGCRFAPGPFLRPLQPGKPGVKQSDRFGRGGPWCGAQGDVWRRHWCQGEKGAAGSLVAPVGSTASRTESPQLQRRFVEKRIGIVGHGVLSGHHTEYLLSEDTSNSPFALWFTFDDDSPIRGGACFWLSSVVRAS